MPSSRPTKPRRSVAAQARGGGCREADASQVKAHGVRHVPAHLLTVGGELWCLRANGAVAIQDAVAAAAGELGHAGEQLDAVGPLVGRVGVGEELAYVAGAHGAQDGIHEGVGHHVRVRVAQKAALAGDVHPAQDEAAPLLHAVDVVAMPNADHCTSLPGRLPQPSSTRRCSSVASATARSSGMVTLMLSREHSTQRTRPPWRSTREESSVPW